MNLLVNTLEEKNKRIIQLSGEIDVYTAPLFKETLSRFSAEKGVDIIIDLSDVNYIDSTGLGVFIGGLKDTDKNNNKLRVLGARERVARLFSITGLDEIIDINVDEKEGI